MTGITTEQADDLIQVLNKLVKGGSLGSGSDGPSAALTRVAQKTRAEDLKLQKAYQKQMEENSKVMGGFNSALNKFNHDLGIKSKLLTNSVEEAIGALDYDSLKEVPGALSAELKKSPIFKNKNISNLNGAYEFINEMASKAKIINSNAAQDYLMNGSTASAESLELLENEAKRTGTSVREVALSLPKLTKEVKAAEKAQQDLNYKMRGGAIGELFNKAETLKGQFVNLKTVSKALYEAFEQVTTSAMKYGTEYVDSFTAFMAGMDPTKMAQNVATYRQSIRAAGMSVEQFRDITEAGSAGLTTYTGSLEESVKLQSSAFESARRMGIDGAVEQRAFMDQQVETFKKFNTVFSLTSEEFVKMNQQIRDSSEINAHMYRLNKKQRAQAHLDIQQTVLRLRTMGLMQDQALKVVEAMSAIAAKSPKERLKQAARLQAVGGAMGFGSEAGEAAKLMRRGFNQEGDRERYAELQQGMQKKMGDFMGKGLPQEMMASQMIAATKMEDILGPKSEFSKLNTQQHQATANIEDLAEKRTELVGQIAAWGQRISNFFAGPIMKILIGIGASLAILKTKLIAGAAAKALGSGAAEAAASGARKGVLRTVLTSAVRMMGPLGMFATLAAGAAGAAIAYDNANTAPEEQTFMTWLKANTVGLGADEQRKHELTKELVEVSAKNAEQRTNAMFDKIMSKTGFDVNAGRVTRNEAGPDRIKLAGGDSETLGKFKFHTSKPEQQRKTIDYAIERLTMKAQETFKEQQTLLGNSKREEAEAKKEQLDLLQQSVDELRGMKEKLDNPDKGVVQAIKEGTETAKDIADKQEKGNKKAVKLLWAREAPVK